MAGPGSISYGLTTQDLLNADTGSDVTTLDAGSGGSITIPGGTMLLTAEFSQQGNDLVVEGQDGSTVVVQDYFTVAQSPTLQTAGGAQLPSDLVQKVAHAGAQMQVAQDGAAVGEQPVGTVDTAATARSSQPAPTARA